MDVMPVVDLGRQPAKATVGEPFPVARDGVPRGARQARRRGRAHRPGRRTPRRRCGWPSTPTIPDRYDAWVTPDAAGAWTFEIQAWSDPVAHLAARRRAQDPRRRRRRADVHRGPAAARAGARRALDPTTADGREVVQRRASRPPTTPSRPPEARLAVLQDPELVDGARPPTRSASCVTVEGPYPAYADRAARAVRQLVRVLPALGGRDAGPEDRQGHQRHLPHRRQAARRRGGDGLRRHLPAADPPDRRGQPQGPQQHPRPRPRRHRVAVGDRLQGRRPRRRSTPTSAPSRTSTPSSPRASEPRPRGRPRPRPPGRARPPVGHEPPASGSPPAPTAPSPTPRTRRRSTRTSTRSTSTTTRSASAARCCGSSGTGCPTACGSSASTTRTPSRWRSGSGCSRRSGAPTPTCSSCPRRSPGRR